VYQADKSSPTNPMKELRIDKLVISTDLLVVHDDWHAELEIFTGRHLCRRVW
jgi:hypothetical protein